LGFFGIFWDFWDFRIILGFFWDSNPKKSAFSPLPQGQTKWWVRSENTDKEEDETKAEIEKIPCKSAPLLFTPIGVDC
jgi:hypothetical protein